ncbi:MAG: hypothetical protein Ct9H300mP16_14140 [Pseudomonadota bacterium]|nr:MAG: hypothetical protein Ct9H300mP16_14140 [Pseudomonadota bacterium]
MNELILSLDQVSMSDVARVGGKNASLGELISRLSSAGIQVPGGFAVTPVRTTTSWRKVLWPSALTLFWTTWTLRTYSTHPRWRNRPRLATESTISPGNWNGQYATPMAD